MIPRLIDRLRNYWSGAKCTNDVWNRCFRVCVWRCVVGTTIIRYCGLQFSNVTQTRTLRRNRSLQEALPLRSSFKCRDHILNSNDWITAHAMRGNIECVCSSIYVHLRSMPLLIAIVFVILNSELLKVFPPKNTIKYACASDTLTGAAKTKWETRILFLVRTNTACFSFTNKFNTISPRHTWIPFPKTGRMKYLDFFCPTLSCRMYDRVGRILCTNLLLGFQWDDGIKFNLFFNATLADS